MPQEDSKREIPASQELHLQREEEERWTTGARAGFSLGSGQTLTLTGGAGNFRPKREERHFRPVSSPLLRSSYVPTFRLPLPGASRLVLTPDVDYKTQQSLRQIDFRVKRPALDLSPWKRSVWSRGGLGYARWPLWGLGLRWGPFCQRQLTGAVSFSAAGGFKRNWKAVLHRTLRRRQWFPLGT